LRAARFEHTVSLLSSRRIEWYIKIENRWEVWIRNSFRLRTLSGHESWVYSVSFDGKGLLASGSGDKTIKLWNTKTGECLRTLSGHEIYINSVSFNGEGLLASGSGDKTIKLWNTKTGECLRTLTWHGSYVNSVSFDGEDLLASGSDDRTIKLWNWY